MSFYQSALDIAAESRDAPDSIPARTSAILSALDGLGRRLSATRFLDKDFSLAQAEAQAKQTNRSAPLFGVPMAHKELYGRVAPSGPWPDEGGSSTCEGQTARQTAFAISQLDKAGSIDCGRLVSVEYALGVTGHNEFAGTPKNPWNPDYICGGSSSGSGSIVAAGIVPGALGSDTGGSIRLPAAACGLVGIKPTYGVVSRSGVFPLSHSLDTVGPLTRSVADGAAMLQAITGFDATDSCSLQVPSEDYSRNLEIGLAGLSIGLCEDYFLTGSDTDMADMTADSFALCQTLGAKGRSVKLNNIDIINPLNVLMIATEAAQIHRTVACDKHHMLNDQTLMRVLAGAFTTAEDYHVLQQSRARAIAAVMEEVFDKVDILMTPVWPFALPTIEESDVGATPDAAPLMQRIGHNTRPVNFLGLPSVCLPTGWDKNGLPVSVQLIGKPYSEATLLQAAAALEREYSFWDRTPDLDKL
jgi:aspartyl-tRNA(Asn)/glutamyl-tRNA(Gln) amidotransferase subunit A